MFPPITLPKLPQRLGTLALLVALALLCLGTPARAQSAQDITNLFSVTKSAPVLDRVNRVYYSYVNLTNTSGATVAGRLRLVVSDSTLPVSALPAPPDGTTADGKPFYWLGDGDQTYAPGVSSGNRRVNFQLRRVRLAYGVRVEILAEAAALVPPSGGVLEITDLGSPAFGARVEIPPGALAGGQVITVKPAESLSPLPADGRQALAVAIDFGPDGLTFQSPVTIHIPYDPAQFDALGALGPESLVVYTFDQASGSWLPVETVSVDTAQQVVVARTSHFSVYTALADQLHSYDVLDADYAPERKYVPVLFVHGVQVTPGIGSSAGTFGRAMEFLDAAGVDVFGLGYESWNKIEYSAASLGKAIEKVKQLTGADKVNIISHSMGGLVTRAYLQDFAINPVSGTPFPYGHDVAKLLMLGCPNQGSDFALLRQEIVENSLEGWFNPVALHLLSIVAEPAFDFLLGGSYEQMEIGSFFLDTLNTANLPPEVAIDLA